MIEIVEPFLCGTSAIKSAAAKSLRWDHLNTMVVKSIVTHPRQQKRQIGGSDHLLSLKKRQDRSDGSHEIPQKIINRLLTESCADINESCESKFGIKSNNSGTLCHVVSVTNNDDTDKKEIDSYISDFYVSKFDKVYATIHSPSTIFAAMDAVNLQLSDLKVEHDRCEEVRGAIADKLLEDISFQIVAEDSLPHLFQSMKVDIDNVRNVYYRKICCYYYLCLTILAGNNVHSWFKFKIFPHGELKA